MTKRMRAPLIWAAVILAMLVGAYAIVARSGTATPGHAAAGYTH